MYGRFRRNARGQDVRVRAHAREDVGDLLRVLPRRRRPREAVAQGAVQVEFGVAEVHVGQVAQALQALVHVQAAVAHGGEQLFECLFHDVCPLHAEVMFRAAQAARP
jgi:hypothetical protein